MLRYEILNDYLRVIIIIILMVTSYDRKTVVTLTYLCHTLRENHDYIKTLAVTS